MKKEKMHLNWAGVAIELCMGRVTPQQKKQIDAHYPGPGEAANLDAWYENADMLKTVFAAENWWSVNDLDHVMGLVFANRTALDKAMTAMDFEIAGAPVTVDPEAYQLSFYAPEMVEPADQSDSVVRHGVRREAHLQLEVNIEPPFDPSLLTLSLIDYPDIGLILIDLDYNGHDDVAMTFGKETYLPPQFMHKEDYR